jgi:hypothetical protein
MIGPQRRKVFFHERLPRLPYANEIVTLVVCPIYKEKSRTLVVGKKNKKTSALRQMFFIISVVQTPVVRLREEGGLGEEWLVAEERYFLQRASWRG